MFSQKFLVNGLALALIALYSCGARPALAGDSSARDQSLATLESQFLVQQLLATDGGLIRSILDPLKTKNRSITADQWKQVAVEIQNGISAKWLESNHPLHQGFRQAMQSFNDEELSKLAQMSTDPLWLRYEEALIQPVLGKAVQLQISESADDVNKVIDQVVRAHHLRLP
jgi:hypothetical protein